MITWYSQMGLSKEALSCFRLMVGDGFCPNYYTYVGAISACASVGSAMTGKEIHGNV